MKDALAAARGRTIRHEGSVLQVYHDSLGYPTVGIGHRVTLHDGLKVGDWITEAKCSALFEKDWNHAVSQANDICADHEITEPVAVGVLAEMTFQLGAGGVRKFRKTLGYLADAEWKWAADEMVDSKWFRQTPKRAASLAIEIASIS